MLCFLSSNLSVDQQQLFPQLCSRDSTNYSSLFPFSRLAIFCLLNSQLYFQILLIFRNLPRAMPRLDSIIEILGMENHFERGMC